MEIRKATKRDAEKIKEISLGLVIPRNTLKSQGLVEYIVPPISEIEERTNGKFLYIATKPKEVIGFLMAYTDAELDRLNFSGDEIVEHILEKNRPFIFWEQLVIKGEYQNKGFGPRLVRKFLDDVECSEYPTIYGPISHSPHRNKVSIRLAKSVGFNLLEEIEAYNGLTFGIYQKILSGKSGH